MNLLKIFFTCRTSVSESFKTLVLSSITSSSSASVSMSLLDTSFFLLHISRVQSLYSTTRVMMMKMVPWTNIQKMYLPKKSQSSLFLTDSNPEKCTKLFLISSNIFHLVDFLFCLLTHQIARWQHWDQTLWPYPWAPGRGSSAGTPGTPACRCCQCSSIPHHRSSPGRMLSLWWWFLWIDWRRTESQRLSWGWRRCRRRDTWGALRTSRTSPSAAPGGRS